MAALVTDLVVSDDRISIGKGTYASGPPRLRAHHPNNRIAIGKYCSLAENVTIFAGGNHPMHQITTHPLALYLDAAGFAEWTRECRDGDETTTIGNDVWLGDGAMVLSGVTVGDGAVIGARAVVARDVPPYAIVAGNPASVVRMRFSESEIAALLRIRWWDWTSERISEAVPMLCSGNIEAFLRYAGRDPDSRGNAPLDHPSRPD